MSVLRHGLVPPTATGYNIERSLRFNSADSAYLNRTPGSAGNRKTWTWSGWVKRSALSTTHQLFTVETVNGSTYTDIKFGTDNKLYLDSYGTTGALQARCVTDGVFRDVSAWYHVVAVLNTPSATAADRAILYVNGVRVSQTITDGFDQDAELMINTTNEHRIGADVLGNEGYLSGYLADVHFIDGSALTPSSFGENDTDTGVWKPKAYTGSYGTNGFKLTFSDNSGTTATTLGKDTSGNGNNWTPNNFSVTAGAGNDSLVDTPTPYGTDTGAGGEVRGNYATLNPLSAVGSTLSNGNLDVSGTSNAFHGTIAVTSGKWYFEFRKNSDGDNQLGISTGYANVASTSFRRSWRDNLGSPSWLTDGSNAGSGTAQSLTTGDILGVALDMDNNAIYFAKNNTWMNSGVPTSGASKTGAIWTDLSGSAWQIYAGGNANGCYTSINAGQRPFAYTAPSGFKALCTTNLPTPTIGATSTTRADDYFNTVLYTGTGSSLSVTGVGFQPDFVWIKERAGAADHGLYDAVRGVQKQLESNTTTAETTETTGLTAFGTDGFTVGALAQLNTNTDTYVAWNWKANGAGSSNTQGTITSTVSANTTSGFSIVTCSPSGSAFTVGHGLGVAPKFIIAKLYQSTADWNCYHASLGAGKYIVLNSTSGELTSSTLWQNTAPTSTVLSFAAVSNPMLFYCFAEVAGYSRFGSYVGNADANGPFIYTGFAPAFVMYKRTDVGDSWVVKDNKRLGYNLNTTRIYPNQSLAEDTSTNGSIDLLSNGFKHRSANDLGNQTGGTYIYMALAENPFKYSLAR